MEKRKGEEGERKESNVRGERRRGREGWRIRGEGREGGERKEE